MHGRTDKMLRICAQLLGGLSHLHEMQILHRDIKAKNILVSAVGGTSAVGDTDAPAVVIADLGNSIKMSASAESGNTAAGVGSRGSDITTYQYRAPELFVTGVRHCNYPSDIWAMGVTIVEMDVGSPPFGRAAIRRSQMMEIFHDQLVVLYRSNVAIVDEDVRRRPGHFLDKLSRLRLRDSRALPWGQTRVGRFQDFARRCFLPRPADRPLAKDLAQDKYFSRALA